MDDGAARVIDATGKIVFPGGIEPHAHIAHRVRIEWAGRPDVFTQGTEGASRAAAFGGVTTIVDFAWPRERRDGEASAPSIMERIDDRKAHFAGHCHTDFTFHAILTGEVPPTTLGEIGEAVQEGVASFKVFTTFGPTRVPYGHLSAVFEEVARSGGIMAVHAEEDEIVRYTREKLKREGRDQGYNLPLVHSNLSEDVAFRTVIRMAKRAGVGIYFVHTTAKEGVEAIAEARDQGLPVYGEALHHYLHFTGDDYKRPGGTAIHTYPALKSAADREALIAGLMDGRLATTATDEYTTSKDVKLWGQTLDSVCGGHNGIETRVPVAFTKLVQERGMPPPAVCRRHRHERGEDPGALPAQGCDLARQRRRLRHDRSQPRKNDHTGQSARGLGLQHLGGLRLPGLSGRHRAAGQGHCGGRSLGWQPS